MSLATLLAGMHERLFPGRAETARQAWLARHVRITDPAQQQRVCDLVDRAIATADPSQVTTDVDGDIRHETACLPWATSDADTSAQKTTHSNPRRIDYALYVDGDDPDEGPAAVVSVEADWVAKWLPGRGFETLTGFLDWFEDAINGKGARR